MSTSITFKVILQSVGHSDAKGYRGTQTPGRKGPSLRGLAPLSRRCYISLAEHSYLWGELTMTRFTPPYQSRELRGYFGALRPLDAQDVRATLLTTSHDAALRLAYDIVRVQDRTRYNA